MIDVGGHSEIAKRLKILHCVQNDRRFMKYYR
ncbi:MAG: hypothetical protein K0R80_2168 [Clostridia bacterium]|jgi:hypothetical protein|nr:hypothetical protein [Clostridia bacterium]